MLWFIGTHFWVSSSGCAGHAMSPFGIFSNSLCNIYHLIIVQSCTLDFSMHFLNFLRFLFVFCLFFGGVSFVINHVYVSVMSFLTDAGILMWTALGRMWSFFVGHYGCINLVV